ncbi:uncharacterized protein BO87DRAFT_36937 [Aspergillus neoniger CBS 115656]|uniref:Uncharacterized protein n=1 Tax=Aspergillus neoniger (strain CBS 115656) TaxID=1448310 RepID=A0A318YKN7_ASPNB|nr:hypothetical protein BO87DRAFT_36937 [Aspergillus neoniger CBS 115656]PYH35091.1 hypothetical protein BO87DRAFT_36937 [Aspergillus neoniger CBS 115656]
MKLVGIILTQMVNPVRDTVIIIEYLGCVKLLVLLVSVDLLTILPGPRRGPCICLLRACFRRQDPVDIT